MNDLAKARDFLSVARIAGASRHSRLETEPRDQGGKRFFRPARDFPESASMFQ